MASSSSRSGSGSGQIPNSGSKEDLKLLMDKRKRRRMESNRESARRSRMTKQKHVDNLMAQIDQLRQENGQILASVSVATHHSVSIEAENSVLGAQVTELSHRLDSLIEILDHVNTANGVVLENENYDFGLANK